MGAKSKVVVFDKFSGGEYDQLEAWNAPPNSFTAVNMLVYKTGELGVRPGLIDRTPSTLPTGVVHAFGGTPVPANDAFIVQGTAARTFDIITGTNLKTAATALTSTPSGYCDYVNWTTDVYIASPTDKIYKLTPNTGATLPVLTGLTSVGAGCISVYEGRMVAGNINGSNIYRLRWSDAFDFTSWPAANFLDVGDNWHIASLAPIRDGLVVGKQVGFWVIRGTLGSNQVVRKASNARGPVRAYDMSVDFLDRVWYHPVSQTFPSMFSGAQVFPNTHLTYTAGMPSGGSGTVPNPPPIGIAPVTGFSDGVLFVGDTDNKAAIFWNGVWTYHTFGVNVSGYVNKVGAENLVSFCDGGAVGVQPKIYLLNLGLDHPGLESATGAQQRAGDASSTSLSGSVTFPEWWSKGEEVRVAAVIVDFRKWDTGSATTNHFDLVVSALRQYDAASSTASATQSFDEAASSSSTSGTLHRKIMRFGDQGLGAGFQLAFTNVRGIAFQRIEVILDTEPVRVA